MATLNITTTALATTNRNRINLYKESAPNAIIDSLTFNAPHNERVWTFFNLEPSQNYRYRWLEIDGAGATIQQYASQHFTTPSAGSVTLKPTEYITVDVTPGLVNGVATAVFDGTGSPAKPNWIGWTPIIFMPGFGPLKPNLHYTFDSATGEWELLSGVLFEPLVEYTVIFEPKIIPSAVPFTLNLFNTPIVVEDDIVLDTEDIKSKIIIAGTFPYLEITLPDIMLVPENRITYFESTIGNHLSAAIKSSTGNDIKFLLGDRDTLYIGRAETLAIYRHGNNWRVHSAEGNFKSVGQFVSEYAPAGNQINKVECTDQLLSATEYSRLYNDYVLKLTTEAVAFVDWPTNKTKFSLADGSGNFHVPDLRNFFERNTSDARPAGSYQEDQFKAHSHTVPGRSGAIATGTGGASYPPGKDADVATNSTGGDETNPKNYAVRRFILV